MELQDSLDALAKVLTVVGATLPGPGGAIAKIASIAFSSAAAIAKSGRDPVTEIERIHRADPLVASVHDEWKDALDEKFGKE